jgi:hypothetical protein
MLDSDGASGRSCSPDDEGETFAKAARLSACKTGPGERMAIVNSSPATRKMDGLCKRSDHENPSPHDRLHRIVVKRIPACAMLLLLDIEHLNFVLLSAFPKTNLPAESVGWLFPSSPDQAFSNS